MSNFKLQAPWIVFYKEVNELFKQDPEVRVLLTEDQSCIKVFVDNPVKAAAARHYLPEVKTFGNVSIAIDVISSNNGNKAAFTDAPVTIEDLFRGNGCYSYTRTYPEVFVNPISYVVFKKEVIQFYIDNLGDIRGNTSCLMQDIAKIVLVNTEGLFFCTDIE